MKAKPKPVSNYIGRCMILSARPVRTQATKMHAHCRHTVLTLRRLIAAKAV